MSDDTRNLLRSQQVGTAIQAGVLHGDVYMASPNPLTTPRQLPMAPRWHLAREQEFSALATALESGQPPLAVIEGAGGVGKTTLALYWAHRNVERFPDGQLFANLRRNWTVR